MYEGILRKEPVHYLDSTDSTNTRLKELARQGAEHGSVLIAGSQTQGRGRLGRSFISPEGGLYLSILWRPETSAENAARLSCAGALAVCAALESFGVRADIKWPNDLLLHGRKLCGILAESGRDSRGFYLVLGIGVNVLSEDFPPELRHIACSVLSGTGLYIHPEQLGRALICELDRIYEAWGEKGAAFLPEYRRRCITPGRELRLGGEEGRALALGIEDDYSLRVRTEDGEERSISFGEVFHIS